MGNNTIQVDSEFDSSHWMESPSLMEKKSRLVSRHFEHDWYSD